MCHQAIIGCKSNHICALIDPHRFARTMHSNGGQSGVPAGFASSAYRARFVCQRRRWKRVSAMRMFVCRRSYLLILSTWHKATRTSQSWIANINNGSGRDCSPMVKIRPAESTYYARRLHTLVHTPTANWADA